MVNKDLELLELFLMLDSSSDEDTSLFYTTEWLKNIEQMSPSQFYETFRMSSECFEKLIQKINISGTAISNLRMKVIVFVFYISHISTYRKLREIFGIPHATLHRIINEISKAIHKIAVKEICFPKPEEYAVLKNGFASLSEVEGAILAIDGTHIAINRPSVANPFDYYNRKGYFSINFICLVDHLQRFRGITYGFGKSHDARIYRCSNLRNLVERISDDTCYVIADSAFGGFENMRTCLSTAADPLTSVDEYNLSRQRIVVENAFGRFKGKFKRFNSEILNGEKPKYIRIVKCGMWIHNFIIEND